MHRHRAFVALGPLTIDLYLPALPTITDDLQTTSAAVQLTLTGTLVGLALGQLVLGPLSDALGRRRPLIAGTALHVLASLLILLAPTIEVLGALRGRGVTIPSPDALIAALCLRHGLTLLENDGHFGHVEGLERLPWREASS